MTTKLVKYIFRCTPEKVNANADKINISNVAKMVDVLPESAV